ncbi:MAG: serine hydrolase [Candidatus Poribacteria bacterium]|nr:serine hydrolase [Candidatus Poribacteria bacterium]
MNKLKSSPIVKKFSRMTAIFVVLGSLAAVTTVYPKGEIGTMAERLDPFIEKAFALDLTPGMAVAVVQGNDVIYAKGFGYADLETQRRVTPETMFYIASTTKSFTAFAAALLDSRGELDLDKPISQYLPNLRLQLPLSADDITMRDLLTHTHGIENGGPVTFRTAFSGVRIGFKGERGRNQKRLWACGQRSIQSLRNWSRTGMSSRSEEKRSRNFLRSLS